MIPPTFRFRWRPKIAIDLELRTGSSSGSATEGHASALLFFWCRRKDVVLRQTKPDLYFFFFPGHHANRFPCIGVTSALINVGSGCFPMKRRGSITRGIPTK